MIMTFVMTKLNLMYVVDDEKEIIMKGWTTRRPEEEGYFWVVRKYFENGELKDTTEPDLWYIDPNSKYGYCAQLGTEDPEEIPNSEEMIEEVSAPEAVYCWDSEETADKKRKNKIIRRWEYWVKPIPKAFFDEKHSIDPYPVLHQKGSLSIEKELSPERQLCDLEIQIARDGKIWLYVNGEAYIRFKPLNDKLYKLYKLIKKANYD